MACMSGGMSQRGISFSSMKQPPLLKQIKSILSEYPDGGQILKELIQNAEDAEASEVKILYDGRRINNQTGATEPKYNRFFKGPALCVYNDAVFTEKDWEGIQMIYSSVKEKDPLKVGRFGLGFKSVFHITDYPCLISTDRLLMIDPQQPTELVNAMVPLCDIGTLEDDGLSAEAFWEALEDTFGLVKHNDTCPGSLFWFPLREEKSTLSETLYDETKVKDLFDGFQQEASSILLFLKNLRKISISIRGVDRKITDYSTVEIQGNNGDIRHKRAEFKGNVKSVASDFDRDDIQNDMAVRVTVTASGECRSYDWHVVNYFVCKSASNDFMALIKDANLGYSPYVGVAAPLNKSKQLQGHIFCFLPLPREGSRLTGLPVHVNGFFALSQNRHHLKWETEEQEEKKIDDKDILWNKFIIKEALPKAYAKLIEVLIERSATGSTDNTYESVSDVYSCFPLCTTTKAGWTTLEVGLYEILKTMRFLFSKQKSCWISLKDASFATFKELPEKYEYVQNAVVRCLDQTGRCHIQVTVDQFSTLQAHASHIQDLSPKLLAQYLHENEQYTRMTSSDKLHILTYLLSDEDFEIVEELELLPLVSGEWTRFRRNGHPIFSCSESVIKILPGLEQRLLLQNSDLGHPLADSLCHIRSRGIYQVKDVTTANIVAFLEETLTSHLGSSGNFLLTLSTSLTAEWLYDVWQFIFSLEKEEMDRFRNVKIVPTLREGTWKEPRSVGLLRLSDMIIVKSCSGDELSDGVCRCFEKLHVNVLQSLPEWIPTDKLKSYFCLPTQKSVIDLLSKIGSSGEVKERVSTFNSSCDRCDKQAFVSFLVKCQYEITSEARSVIQGLQLFRSVRYVKEAGIDGSVLDCPRFIFGTDGFPENVALPFPCLVIDGEYENLMKKLGARRVLLDELVIEVLKNFEIANYQNIELIERFMDFVIKNFHLFRNNPAVVNYARNTPFLKTSEHSLTYKVSQLFDPSDSKLQDLLYEESLIPGTNQIFNNEVLGILKCFGLKSQNDIDADVLLKVAISLDIWAKGKSNNIAYAQKARALMEQLTLKPSLLDDSCSNGQHLKTCLESLSCILVLNTIASPYPSCLKWYKHESELCKPTEAKEVSMCLLVGATMPTVVCNSNRVNELFKWKQPPRLSKVVEQLQAVRECYTLQNRSDLMQSIKTIFDYMSRDQEEASRYKTAFITKELLWTGEKFAAADRVTIKSCIDDIDLCPYFYKLPSEFSGFQSLFSVLGCRPEQDRIVLQEALHSIKSEHSKPQQKQTVKRDRRMVCAILEKIANLIREQDLIVTEEDLLMMVEDKCENTLKLQPVLECTYDDDPACFSELDDNIFLVHHMIPYTIAETLGVKSITKKAILNAEELGVEEWGQTEPLTTRIHTLLRDAYTDGLSVPKELIQNADDAGASAVKFLYDERQHIESKERVLSKGMRRFQGPAFWAYNNAMFSADDLKNITKLNAGTKESNQKKIGKFGLGFCSVYNLTDLPSFVTGSNIVFFDPHEKHLGSVIRNKGTGLKYKLPNQTLVSRHIDQFKPYDGVFGCDITNTNYTGYSGTLFRLPLRTEEQAKDSQILKRSYTHEEMIELLRMMIKAAGNMLLFTQNVKSIEIYHLAEKAVSAADTECIYSIQKECFSLVNGRLNPVRESVLSRLPDLLQENSSFQEIHLYNYEQKLHDVCHEVLGNIEKIKKHSNNSWLISWATGDDASRKMYETKWMKGALPLSAVAIPCADDRKVETYRLEDAPACFYPKGHVFCFLPLPLITGLPIHINGCFAVTSDRRQLVSITEDDKESTNRNWNNHLMEDALVKAHINLLKTLSSANSNRNYTCYELWPSSCEDVALPFKMAFYRHIIVTDARVFAGMTSWFSFSEISFLDPKIRQGSLGDLIFQVSSYFTVRTGKIIIDMPEFVLENIKKYNEDKIEHIQSAIIEIREFCLIFLQNLTNIYWLEKISERNKLILMALRLSDEHVKAQMRIIGCIPTSPSNVLHKPSELIHPNSKIAVLFNESDERFPLKETNFCRDFHLKKLVEIGMISDILPNELLLNRCYSISNTANSCCGCAFDRCKVLVKYMCNEGVLNKLRLEKNILNRMSDISMFPVLPKPKLWAFSWKASENCRDVSERKQQLCKIHDCTQSNIVFAKSKQLFRQDTCDLVGMVEYVANESVFGIKTRHTDVLLSDLKMKGKDNIQLETVVDQMMTLSMEYRYELHAFQEIQRIHPSLLLHFESILKNRTGVGNTLDILKKLSIVPVVLINRELVKTSNVALSLKHEYPPILYKVPEYDQLCFRKTYTFLGVKQTFTIEDILNAFDYLKKTWGENQNADIENSNALLMNLKCCLEESNTAYDAMPDIHERIYAPDIECVLRPTKELVIENEKFEANTPIKILHQGIVPLVAKCLGVKAKEMKCFEDISEGIPFGQHEKLETRIKGLLHAYPCDSSIMNELLQNADDAGATEINFVKDYRTHATNRLFHESCKPFQGPSLCVYNNSYFTKKDIEGLHNLGKGSKHEDPTKTGQYGVGFNAVYHLTDTPSFLTRGPDIPNNGLLIFLDPLCKHVPKANPSNPGQMCSFDGVKTNFFDHLSGYSCDFLLQGERGTVFRFPLRNMPSNISSEIVDITKMDEILKFFKEDMYDAILFLKNITSIKISNLTSGRLVEEYSVHVRLNNDAKRERLDFTSKVLKYAKKNRDNKEQNLDMCPFQTVYQLEVLDSEKRSSKWAIVQQFGFSGSMCDLEYIKQKMTAGDIGQMPLGGLAIPLKDDRNAENKSAPITKLENQFLGRAFCFLPLPLRTGFPLHINGHFALDHEARRNLGDEGYKKKWNECLANYVILPAWHSGLVYLQSNIQKQVLRTKKWCKIHQIFKHYHSMFPVQGKTSGEFWNDMICNFYQLALQDKKDLFPYVLRITNGALSQSECFETPKPWYNVLWTSVCNHSSQKMNSGVFNDIENHLPFTITRYSGKKPSHLIEELLKSFGMKLLHTPSEIWLTMKEEVKLDIPVSTPDFVIDFLKTHSTCSEQKCHIGQINTSIRETRYRSSLNLRELVKFLLKDINFYARLEGLPILLTSDSFLRACSSESPIFISEFSELLPQSASYFMHEEILSLIDEKQAFDSNCFKPLQVADVVSLLKISMDPLIYAAGNAVSLVTDNQNSDQSVSEVWLGLYYDFLMNNSFKDPFEITPQELYFKVDMNKFRKNISLFSEWSFLPCVRKNSKGDQERVVLPISEASHVVHLSDNFLKEGSGKSFTKLELPELDISAFKKCKQVGSFIMKCIVAAPERPNEVLECLEYHRQNFRNDLAPEDAVNILAFFARNLDTLRKTVGDNIVRKKMKLLPLFLTQHASLTPVNNKLKVIILPEEIPFQGLQEWADACNVTLLQKNDSVQTLYNFLDLKTTDIYTVYEENILPAFKCIRMQHWMYHIQFLRDRLMNKRQFTVCEMSIIKKLTNLQFISVKGTLKRANEFYSKRNNMFASMLDNECFPPENLQTEEWYNFLVLLGLKCNLDDAMLLRFAGEIEREGTFQMTRAVRVKSTELLKCLLVKNGTKWQPLTLSKLKSIRFVCPYTIPAEMKMIFNQVENAKRFVCFENSISEKHKMLCWTSTTLIDDKLCKTLDETVRMQLGIFEQPPIDQVVLHCQNVCDSFKTLLKKKSSDVDKQFVKKQMKSFYEYFEKNIDEIDDKRKAKLTCKPIIYLPEDNEIVTVNSVAIELPTSDQIKPYLYTAPVFYGEFFELFQKLGCRKMVDFCHFARVLEIIKGESDSTCIEMTLPERNAARKAIQQMFSPGTVNYRNASDCERLYLPNIKMILTNAKELVVSNRISYEERLKGKSNIQFFVGFQSLKLDIRDEDAAIRKLPDRIRPRLLTEAVTESLCSDMFVEINNSIKARKIQRFLHSEYLAHGLLRILKSQRNLSKQNINDTSLDEIQERLKSISVKQVSTLKTALHFEGMLVAGSEKKIFYYIKHLDGMPFSKQIFYFQDNCEHDRIFVNRLQYGLKNLVFSCAKGLNEHSALFIPPILQKIEQPEMISCVLDELDVSQYNLAETEVTEHFPDPGTAVDPRFFPFLEQGIFPFEEYEYESVAMDLDDTVLDDDGDNMKEPVYIYVRIIYEVSKPHSTNLSRVYAVNTGNPDISVENIPIYRLFRFVRKREEPGNSIQRFGDELSFDLPSDETCKRIRDELTEAWMLPEEDRKRVIRRLYLKWYPDRNLSNKDYCSKVFIYIKIIISRLENREIPDRDVKAEISRGPSNYSASSFYFANVHRRAEAYVQAYKNNIEEYRCSHRSGRYFHTSAVRVKRQDITEAYRWFRQAKNDFLAARTFFSVADAVDGFNWICYTCHQACEKALKSAYYAKDADNVPKGSDGHSLVYLASDENMRQQASLLEERLGNHTRLRYPDALSRPKTPSDLFTREDAEFSINVAERMVNLVEEYIS